jgi:glyoxylase-like metal-dependent hydrolase (beta-lactamase superfamily II)
MVKKTKQFKETETDLKTRPVPSIKTKKRTIFAALAVFLIVLLSLLLIVKFYCKNDHSFRFSTVRTGQIQNTNIYAIRSGIGKELFSNAFLIDTNNGYILIDAGGNMADFEASLSAIGIHANDVKWIFLTHSDRDHIAALPLFPNAQVHMSEDEILLLNGTIPRHPSRTHSRYNSIPDGIDIEKIILLSDDQELFFNGVSIKAIKAPGHTHGSMVYLADNRYLFTGDVFSVTNGRIGVHTSATERLRETVNNSSIVFTSHWGFHYSIRY